MRLVAISDLHVGHPINREALRALPPHRDDWLIVGGDVAEGVEEIVGALEHLQRLFARVIWVPGNHELWAFDGDVPRRAPEKYQLLVERCRTLGVATPEDEFLTWPGDASITIAPLFVPYDYTFRPDGMNEHEAMQRALSAGVMCADERMIDPSPFESMEAWCDQRVQLSWARLAAVPRSQRLVIINHFPLRRDLVRIPAIPTFEIWCGTRRTEGWHLALNVECVVSGHLHLRATDLRDGVRFEEVSLGYPRQWRTERGLAQYLRQILPAPQRVEPRWAMR